MFSFDNTNKLYLRCEVSIALFGDVVHLLCGGSFHMPLGMIVFHIIEYLLGYLYPISHECASSCSVKHKFGHRI
jgi:hypothetical protein